LQNGLEKNPGGASPRGQRHGGHHERIGQRVDSRRQEGAGQEGAGQEGDGRPVGKPRVRPGRPRDGRPGRDDRKRSDPAQRGDKLFASTENRDKRERQPDPNSPFAKLLALKAELEGKTKKD